MANRNSETESKQRAVLVEWLNSILPNLSLPIKASDEELRANLVDGTVLCKILNRVRPGSVNEEGYPKNSSVLRSENVKRFLTAVDELGIPRFEVSDLEKGSMKAVVDCLLGLKAQFVPSGCNLSTTSIITKPGNIHGDASSHGPLTPLSREKRLKASSESKLQQALHTPLMSEPSAAVLHHVGHKFHEVFQLKQGRYADLPATKISEMMKSNSLDNAPTQSLLSVVNGILDESVERKNGEIPHRVACLLRKVVQEIERRISTQAEHLRTQNNLFKAREEKYQSRIRVLEALASGAGEETKHVTNQLQQIKTENSKVQEKRKVEEQEIKQLMKENDKHNLEISALKQELEIAKKMHEQHCFEVEAGVTGAKAGLQIRIKELECLLADSNNKVKELEVISESKCQRWNVKENIYQSFMDFQFGAMKELRVTSHSIKQEILKTQKSYSEEFNYLEVKLKALADAAANYHAVLAENRKLFNELQDLKGNIRVYCRIRPFLPGQTGKQTIIENIGENGQLVIANPSKPGKDGQRSFKFNKVFGPAATQGEVFQDIQPFVQSVVDGYNVCIFAYGQTGSGKTYTMTGPNGATEEEWGVNYRALNSLFKISQNRRSTILYEVGVQMVEIYNEQVRDLLSSGGSQKKLGITTISQPNGLAVPDATMLPVTSTSDVLDLMNIGLKNRAVSATALNERSSRSHSIVTIHVCGKDLKVGTTLYGNLHLVDLAGSERVDRSEVTGDRLKEAQHINKSLSSLGDVIFALAQKTPHVPYRNSKLTQVLQSSLGGQAKTLMFVQLNPDATSYSESMSTLKFAERVSGVELGAARSSKEGKDVRELMEQMASLKDTIAKKDEEIERLQLLKDLKGGYPSINGEQHGTSSLSDKHFEADYQQSTDDEKFTEISDGTLSMGTETDGSTEYTLSPEGINLEKTKVATRTRLQQKLAQGLTASRTDSSRVSTSIKKSVSSTSLKPSSRRWQ
ncbi:kinesin-like protein KIN-14K isoform X2 [Herrania umbratica]|uniref:Kinesin-like protein KIN-14K isoform X2 n=1 Tax=Herrania umbratica TaxID=108875 RepID=A0A6J1AZC2_9ROSI|nr:kinesin-like protein KIN-14K isoform X2 [Herrania umbratica]